MGPIIGKSQKLLKWENPPSPKSKQRIYLANLYFVLTEVFFLFDLIWLLGLSPSLFLAVDIPKLQ